MRNPVAVLAARKLPRAGDECLQRTAHAGQQPQDDRQHDCERYGRAVKERCVGKLLGTMGRRAALGQQPAFFLLDLGGKRADLAADFGPRADDWHDPCVRNRSGATAQLHHLVKERNALLQQRIESIYSFLLRGIVCGECAQPALSSRDLSFSGVYVSAKGRVRGQRGAPRGRFHVRQGRFETLVGLEHFVRVDDEISVPVQRGDVAIGDRGESHQRDEGNDECSCNSGCKREPHPLVQLLRSPPGSSELVAKLSGCLNRY